MKPKNHTSFTIESNVPLPDHRTGYKYTKYPFHCLGVGDSFALLDRGAFVRARGAAAAHSHNYGVKFTTDVKQLRIWRIA